MEALCQTINCDYHSVDELYKSYMPFVKNGGLFIQTSHRLPLGEEVYLQIQLPAENGFHSIKAKVAWITPNTAQINKPQGLGFQFIAENSSEVQNKIECYLANMLKSEQKTYTI